MGRHRACWSAAAFEDAQLEIAGLRIDPGKILPHPIAAVTMTPHAIPAIVILSVLCMAGHIRDVALHPDASLEVSLGLLRQRSQWKHHHNCCHTKQGFVQCYSHAVLLEVEVKSEQQAVAAQVCSGHGRGTALPNPRILVVESKPGAARHEGVIPVAHDITVDITKSGWIGGN